MAEVASSKGSPTLDMTPMVELAFLLVTFFMLTATSRVTEPVVVDTPSSTADKLLPEAYRILQPGEDIARAVEKEFETYGVKRFSLR